MRSDSACKNNPSFCELNGLHEFGFYAEKFDSAASSNMSGIDGRLSSAIEPPNVISIHGFNGSVSKVDAVGKNSDGLNELYVKDMPADYALLCANMYAREGAAVLFADDGSVLKLNDDE